MLFKIAESLATSIEEHTGIDAAPVWYDDGIIEVDSGIFMLKCELCGNNLVVCEIDVQRYHQGDNLGRALVMAFCQICREFRLVPAAREVQPEAEGFWNKLGFRPCADGDDYYEFIQ